MMISLPPELEAFAHRQVANGKYGSIEALLAAGVRALIDREDIYEGRLEELQREAQIAINSLESGKKIDSRKPGLLVGKLNDAFFEPLSEEELQLWE